MTLEEEATYLNKLPFVRWDRTVRIDDDMATVFGWIDRVDGRSDFVQLAFWATGQVWATTSSAERSAEINRLLTGADHDDGHYPCQRVETVYGSLVDNVIEL